MTTRLPKPGADAGNWGTILNDFLDVSHASDGTLNSNTVGTTQIQDNAVTNAQLDTSTQTTLAAVAGKYSKPGSGIPGSDLDSSTQADLAAASTAVQSVNSKSGNSIVLGAGDVGALAITGGTMNGPIFDHNGRSIDHQFFCVDDYGADPTGIADSTAAIQSVIAKGANPLFGPGTYLCNTYLLLQVSNVIWKGAGMYSTTLTAGSGLVKNTAFIQSNISKATSNVAIEDLAIDGGSSGVQVTLLVSNGNALCNLRMSRIRFLRSTNGAISLSNTNGAVLEDIVHEGVGDGTGSITIHLLNCSNVHISRLVSRYTGGGIEIDGNPCISQDIIISEPFIDLGWYTLIATSASSGANVTYTTTSVTDTSASFPAIKSLNAVRAMPILATSSGATVTYSGQTLVDTAANFLSSNVNRGYIVRAGGRFGIVSVIPNATTIQVEEWLSDTDRSRISSPTNGVQYTVYQVIIGQVSSNTSTTITVKRWFDFFSGLTVLPPGGTLYELTPNPGTYPIFCTQYTQRVRISNGTIRRGWGDNMELFGDEMTTTNNDVADGQDEGIVFQGYVLPNGHQTGNRCRSIGDHSWHNGASSLLFAQCADGVAIGTNTADSPYNNVVANTTQVANITLNDSLRCRIIGCTSIVNESQVALVGMGVISGTDSLVVDSFVEHGHPQNSIYMADPTVTNTKLRNLSLGAPINFNTSVGTTLDAQSNSGSPEGVLAAPIGTMYADTAGGDLWFKQSGGTTSSGWSQVTTS